MFTNDELRLPGNGPHLRARTPGLPSRILTTLAGIVAIVGAFAVSLVVFAAVAAATLVVGSYLWWKTRTLRRRMREQPPGGRIIEGEVIQDESQP
jgi:membrane protein DedA with SNARE-associated domain